MRFVQFLLNEDIAPGSAPINIQRISLEEAADAIIDGAPSAARRFLYGTETETLYRGNKRMSESPAIVNTVGSQRISKKAGGTRNYYTLFLDNNPEFTAVAPKRSESIVCTNRMSDAQSYGRVSLVFPLESKSTVAVFEEEYDIWGIEMKSPRRMEMQTSNLVWEEFEEILRDQQIHNVSDTSWGSWVEADAKIKELTPQEIDDAFSGREYQLVYKEIAQTGLINTIHRMYSPKNLEANILIVPPSSSAGGEHWISGQVITVPIDDTFELEEMLRKRLKEKQ
jgi:hypothetical protein